MSDIFKEHFSDKALKQLSRRLFLRILVAEPVFAEQIPLPCYLLSQDILNQIGTVDDFVLQIHNENRIICLSDRTEILSIKYDRARGHRDCYLFPETDDVFLNLCGSLYPPYRGREVTVSKP